MDFIQKRSDMFIEENNEIDKYLVMINYENITESVRTDQYDKTGWIIGNVKKTA